MNIDELLKQSFNEKRLSLKSLLISQLEATGLSRTQFERLVKIERKSLEHILNNTSKQTDVIKLLKIGEFLGLSINELLILFLQDRPKEEISELQSALELTFIHKYFDLKTLSAINFIQRGDDVSTIKNRIETFFGLRSLYEYERDLNEALYSRTKRSFDDKMKDFWIKSSYKYFELIDNPNEFNREALVELIPKIKPYTANIKDGLLTVFRALFFIGVTVVFQPSLPKTQIRGATFLVNNKPCIVITDLLKNYATIWFALIHELHHVLYDLETISKTQYHLSGEPDLFLMQEDKANSFAREYLFSEDKLKNIEPFIHNRIIVQKKAKQYNVHPCIIYAMFQHWKNERGENYWGAFKKEFPNYETATRYLNYSNWNAASIKETADKIKNILTV
ncbi:ImmA/IrrE family metallo-endopeptidase [Maribacter sp.]|uniref:ImmA/IrrE family metallo-endopeptidase n=1 Tax=Maribacter sp. TaxID=1897614 RepID=UPI0025BCC64D|nr:hypothetical protein [Maribacter sp.]